MQKQLWAKFVSYIHILFGDFHYRPPAWLARSANWLKSSRFGLAMDRWIKAMKADPRKAATYAAAAAVLLIGGAYGVHRIMAYYASLPEPNYATIDVRAPREPDLETKKISHLLLRFSQSAAPLEALDKPVTSGIELSPEIHGSWHWANDKTLEFIPAGDWAIGQHYKIKLRKSLVPAHILLKEFELGFDTPELKGNITKHEFYQDPRDMNIKRVVTTVVYNYPLDTEDFKKRLGMTVESKDSSVLGVKAKAVPFSVSFGKFQNEAYLQTEPIPIPKEDATVEVKVAKGVKAAKGGNTDEELTKSADVPGMFTYFKFEDPQVTFARNDRYEPEQVLVLTSKAEVASETVAKSIQVYLLPAHLPADKDKKRHHWHSPSEMTKDVQALWKPLPLTLIPTENETSTLHSFKTNAPVGQYLYIKIPKGLKSYGGYELAHDYEAVLAVPSFPKELLIMSQGSLLSYSGDKKIPLLGRNVHKVDFHVSRILPDQLNQLIVQVYGPSGDFSHPNFGYFSDDTLAEKFVEKRTLKVDSPTATQYFSFDLNPYLNKGGGGHKGLFFLKVQENKGSMQDSRLILLTDLGVVAKESVAHTHDVFVQNVHSGLAVSGATVEVVGANGIAVMEVKTGPDGRASFPDLRDFKNEKRPIAFVVHKDGDLSYLPYQMSSRQLNYSAFDVGGVFEGDASDSLSAFMFSDRGIYRPGDTINLGMIIRAKNWKKSFSDLPITWSVTDARGTEVHREKIKADSSSLMALKFDTQDFSPTGNYEIRVFITKKNEQDQQIGSISVRVEEFVPDRMRISTHLTQERVEGWVSPKDLKAIVTLKNLFGTAAENRTVKATLNLIPAQPYFRSLRDYTFNEFKHEDKVFSETLDPKTTDASGTAEFDLDLARFDSGMFSLRFDAEGFEATGGRAVTAGSAVMVSPLPYLVGFKRDSDLSYITKGSGHSVDLIAVNSELKKIAVEDLQIQLVERKYISSLLKQNDGTYKYQSVLKEIPGAIKPFKIAATGGKYPLPTETPGDYSLWIKNGAGAIVNKVPFSVAGEANISRSLEKNAELQLVLNKKDFKAGEEIEMQIKAPYAGAGLITIERDKVFTSKWFKTSTTSTIERIKIPEGVEGSAYVNVTFLRAIDSKEIFMSPLSYAVQPFSVSLDSHKLKVTLESKDLVKPGDKLHITYSASQKTKMILYGVDEGILLVARYKLPDPLTYFFQRRALQVKTYQLLDLLLPEYSVVQSLSAPGGDADGALGKNLNPFKRKSDKPIVFWSGVIEAGPGKKTFTYDVPDYFNGNIKIMAVAANNAMFGSVEKPVLVRGDFILSPNVPNFVAPGDEFEIGSGVANQAEGSGPHAKIQVALEKSELYEVLGPAAQTVEIGEGHEGAVHFRLKAKSKLGSAKVQFLATSGGKSAKSAVEFSIRPAVPYMSTLHGGLAEKKSFDIPVERQLLSDFRKQKAGLSPVPAVLMEGVKTFLDGFPYGCTEQAVSKAMPYVILKNHPEFKITPAQSAEMFKNIISVLRTRQTGNGGFGMYTPGEGDNVEASLYVLHYFIEARDHGFAVPEDVYTKVLQFAESETLRTTNSLVGARQFAYALYLQARSGKVPGNDVTFLHKALQKNFKKTWENDLAAAYLAATYKLLKQDDLARELFGKLTIGDKVVPDYAYFYDGFSRDTAILYLAAKHFPDRLKALGTDDSLRKAIFPLTHAQFNTYSASHALMALEALMANASKPENANGMEIAEIQAGGAKQVLNLNPSPIGLTDFSDKAEKLHFQGPGTLPLFYAQLQTGFDRDLPKTELKRGLEITREYLNSKGEPVKIAKVGEELTVRIRARGMNQNAWNNIVMVDLIPGGFEPVLEQTEPEVQEEQPQNTRSHDGDESYEGEGEGGGNVPDLNDQPQPIDDPPPPNPPGDGGMYRFLDLILPHAWAEDTANALSSAISMLRPQYVDRREDRMVIYSGLTDQAQEFRYKIKAVNQGRFVVPPPFGQSMYDNDVEYRGLSSTIEVNAP